MFRMASLISCFLSSDNPSSSIISTTSLNVSATVCSHFVDCFPNFRTNISRSIRCCRVKQIGRESSGMLIHAVREYNHFIISSAANRLAYLHTHCGENTIILESAQQRIVWHVYTHCGGNTIMYWRCSRLPHCSRGD